MFFFDTLNKNHDLYFISISIWKSFKKSTNQDQAELYSLIRFQMTLIWNESVMFSSNHNIIFFLLFFPRLFWYVLLQINVTPKQKELEIWDWSQIKENWKSFNNLTDKRFLSSIEHTKHQWQNLKLIFAPHCRHEGWYHTPVNPEVRNP